MITVQQVQDFDRDGFVCEILEPISVGRWK